MSQNCVLRSDRNISYVPIDICEQPKELFENIDEGGEKGGIEEANKNKIKYF